MRSIKALEEHVAKLETEHDTCNLEIAKGEISGYGAEWLPQPLQLERVESTCTQLHDLHSYSNIATQIFQVVDVGREHHESCYICVLASGALQPQPYKF